MTNTIDKIKTLVWLAFREDLTASEHTSLGDAMRADPIVVFHEANGVWFNSGYANPAYFVEMYDVAGFRAESIRMNGWFLSNLHISGHYGRSMVNFSVTDPLGASERKAFGDFREGLRSALVFLRSASSYSCLADLKQNDPNEAYAAKMAELETLQRENKRLQAEMTKSHEQVEALQKEIERLQAQIETVKSAILPPSGDEQEGQTPESA